MKIHSKGFLFALGILVCAGNCAAWIPESHVIRKERTVEVSVVEQEARVRVRSVFQNPTTAVINTRAWWPVSMDTKDMKCFINAEEVLLHEFQERAQLDALADAAEEQKDARFFRLAESPWKKVFRTTEFNIPVEETTEIIWEYTLPTSHQGGFDGIEIFLNDGVKDEVFHIEFSLAQAKPIRHIWAPLLSKAIVDRSETSMVALRQIAPFFSTENLRILWSGEEDPEASFFTGDHEYRAHFRPLPPAQEFQNVTLLLDASGSMSDVWLHVQELLRFLLEHQQERSFRVAFIGAEGIEWVAGNNELFELNSLALRKKVIESVSWHSPLGTSDISAVLPQLSQPVEDHVLIIFSDTEEVTPLSEGAPVAVLQFFPTEQSSVWQKLAVATRGVVQRAFRGIVGTQEAEELLSSVESRSQSLWAADVIPQENEKEILPKELIAQGKVDSPVFIGRIDKALQSNLHRQWFDWLPRQWAALRIAETLETGEREQQFSSASLDAVLSLARTFGIETAFFTENTTRVELEKTLSTSTDIWLTVEKLWKTNTVLQETGIRLINGVPLWKDIKNIWRSFDFYDRVKPERWIKIAPFSAAQRQLFVLFPEIFAKSFGIAEQVEFCTLFRCFSIVQGGRVEALPSDRAFIRDFDPNHWANSFVIDLVDKNILQPALNGKLHLERPVSRGEFVQMFVVDTHGENFQQNTNTPSFTDLLPEALNFNAVELLKSKGVIKGYPDGTFRPMQDLSRAEAVKILLAADDIIPQEIDVTVAPTFSDAIGWERPWVEEAARRGIVQGHADGLFRPHDPLSRAAAAKVIVQSRPD